MITAVVSRLVILVFGTLYPAYASYKAVRTKNVREYVKWMMYWIVFALFSCAETFTDVFLSFWFPFYYEIKILLVLWLLSPATKGSSILYRKFVHPMLSRREQDIDEYIAKAKEQGYHTVLHLGTKGVNYATTVIMQTAIKGGGGLVQQLRRSYSLGDLSSDVDGDNNSGRKALPEAQDRIRDRERVASDGRHHRPRGHSPRRSASGSGRVEMYFPEVDVDVRGTSVREPSVPLSHIRSSEDVSSGYSSAEPLYQQGGSVGSGQRGEGHHDSLASSREPLVRTASVGGSSRSTRTRSSRGGGGTTGKKSSTAGVPEASEETSLGGEDSPFMSSPSPPNPRSRSNSLPISPDLRPELIALLQALNAELEHGLSMSKLGEMRNAGESMETTIGRSNIEQMSTESSSGESKSTEVLGGISEKSQINVSALCFSDVSDISPSIGCDDIFYDSVCLPSSPVSKDCQIYNEDEDRTENYSEPMTEPQNVIITSVTEPINAESLLVSVSPPSSEILLQAFNNLEATVTDDIEGNIKMESVLLNTTEENSDQICALTNSEKPESVSSIIKSSDCIENLTTALPETDLHKSKENEPCIFDNKANINFQNTMLHQNEKNNTLNVNCLDHKEDKGQATIDKINHKESVPLDILNSKLYINYSATVSEHTLLESNDKNVSPNSQIVTEEKQGKIVSSENKVLSEEKQNNKIVTSENKIITKEKNEEKMSANDQENHNEQMRITNSTHDSKSENSISDKQVSVPVVTDASMESNQLSESIASKLHEPIENYGTDTVQIVNVSTSDSQTSGNLDANLEQKKDIRSGKYHKLQAPEPPQRTRRSSSKSSTSEECDMKSVHRSRSPKKAVDSPVAKLHDQIENLAAMLPFWKGGKRLHGKETGGAGEVIRIREMSRSPSRRTRGQHPL